MYSMQLDEHSETSRVMSIRMMSGHDPAAALSK